MYMCRLVRWYLDVRAQEGGHLYLVVVEAPVERRESLAILRLEVCTAVEQKARSCQLQLSVVSYQLSVISSSVARLQRQFIPSTKSRDADQCRGVQRPTPVRTFGFAPCRVLGLVRGVSQTCEVKNSQGETRSNWIFRLPSWIKTAAMSLSINLMAVCRAVI